MLKHYVLQFNEKVRFYWLYNWFCVTFFLTLGFEYGMILAIF